MTNKELLEKLKQKSNLMNLAIELIEQEIATRESKQTAKAILKSIRTDKANKRTKPHWTQLPENKAKLKKMGKRLAAFHKSNRKE